jgi:hypothetical protein
MVGRLFAQRQPSDASLLRAFHDTVRGARHDVRILHAILLAVHCGDDYRRWSNIDVQARYGPCALDRLSSHLRIRRWVRHGGPSNGRPENSRTEGRSGGHKYSSLCTESGMSSVLEFVATH